MCQSSVIHYQEIDRAKLAKTLVIGCLEFQGPFFSSSDFGECPGLVAVIETDSNNKREVLNVYYSANIKKSANLELSFNIQSGSNLAIAAYYAVEMDAQLSTSLAFLILRTACN